MQNTDPFAHYQTEDPTGGCRAMCAGVDGVLAIVIIVLIALFIIFHPGF